MIRQWMMVLVMVLLVTVGCGKTPEAEILEMNQTEEVSKETFEPEIVEEITENPTTEPTTTDTEADREVASEVVEVDSSQEGDLEESSDGALDESQEELSTEDSENDDEVENQRDGTTVTEENLGEITLGNGTQVSEVRAIWLSYLDLQPIFSLDSEASYREALSEIIVSSKDLGLNTIMYQIRPFGDALYPSNLFPSSYIVTGTGNEGDELPYDPFGIAVEMCHENDLRIEAWINPYRIRSKTSVEPLLLGGIADTWLNDGSRRALQATDGTLVYNPSNDEVKALIIGGVQEVIDLYQVDGIHFDDYFYPTTEASFDEIEYLGFLHDNDALTHDEWRRSNVNTLIAEVYEVVQTAERNIVFGISPYGDIDANYNQLYADVALWASESGYVDYLIPQIYFGFTHSQYPYSETLKEWYELSNGSVKIMPGISVYKIGKEDKWAGDGLVEWVESEEILAKMIIDANSNEGYAGFALFRYDSLFNPAEEFSYRMLLEIKGLKKVLTN